MKDLNNFKKKIFSQNGEDGIVEEILNRLGGSLDKICCEFGAWDGIHLSNIYNLVKNKNYKGLYIEGDDKKFVDLKKNFERQNVTLINKYVSFEGKNNLDNILKENNVNSDFDLLSIDIDGNDYHIFESLNKFKPKIVIIEFNPLIPNEIEFVQKKDKNINQGSSALSLYNLGKKKDYFLVAATEWNLIFVHDKYINKVLDNKLLTVTDVVDDSKFKNFIFVGFDGKIFTSKKLVLPWHKIKIDEIKVLPSFLQKFPENYNFFEKSIFNLYKLYKKFFSLLQK